MGIVGCGDIEGDSGHAGDTGSIGGDRADPAECADESHDRRVCIPVEGECPDCSVTDCTALIYDATLCLPDRVDAECGPGEGENTCCFIGGGGEVCDGRPFVVDGSKRVSEVVARADWRAESPSGPPRPEWIERALDEHASVAAFGRFVLELLAVGAPAQLVADAVAAMRDEVEHARLCFGVAGRAFGPGPLMTEDAPLRGDLATMARTTLVEGAIGETLAAVRAAREADVERDPQIREILERIASDETRHADLAWRVIAWILDEQPELEPQLARTFEDALAAAAVPDVEAAILRPCYASVVRGARAASFERAHSGPISTQSHARA